MRSLLFAILLLALLAVCYWSAITGMYYQWTHDGDMGHGMVAPFIAGWVAWRERGRWLGRKPSPERWGFAVLIFAAALGYLARIGAGLFLESVALWIAVIGIVLAIGGVPWLRGLAFPLLLLLFALPKLAVVYNQVTLPLQLAASRMAAGALGAIGMNVVREGNILALNAFRISVAEACNGVRYLLSLSFIAVVYAYFVDSRPWMRVALALATIPVSILANALRVALTCLAGNYYPQLAPSTVDNISGWIVFAACLASLAGCRWAIGRIVKPTVTGSTKPAESGAPQPFHPAPVLVFLTLNAAFVLLGSPSEFRPAVPNLDAFPRNLPGWTALYDSPIPPEALLELRANATLSRYYTRTPGSGAMHLMVAWFQTQQEGRQPHSPKVCLPGSGWEPVAADSVRVGDAMVNRYVVANGPNRSVVLYWYQTPARTLAGEWESKAWLMADALLHHRTDAALIRVVAPVMDGNEEQAAAAALQFAEAVCPMMRKALPGLSAPAS